MWNGQMQKRKADAGIRYDVESAVFEPRKPLDFVLTLIKAREHTGQTAEQRQGRKLKAYAIRHGGDQWLRIGRLLDSRR
jgi:hypothetical protein